MSDCISCRHTQAAQAPDGRLDFSRRVCIQAPPTPVALPGPQPGMIQIHYLFPVVGPGMRCAQHEPTLIGDDAPKGETTQ